VRFPFRTNSFDGVLEGAVTGLGLAALPTIIADSIPVLRRIRLDEEPPIKPIIVAMHRDMRSVPRCEPSQRAHERGRPRPRRRYLE